MKSIISRKIKDTKVLEILYEIIDSVNGINGIYGKGVPIGNYLSQYFANLYLTGFDHWCKEELKCRYYYRYADDIDAGNSNITEGEAIEIVDNLRRFTDKEKRLSKYAACEYLNVSRATFDNYVREGKLPRGKHEIGFKELSWNKKTLDEFIRRSKHEK